MDADPEIFINLNYMTARMKAVHKALGLILAVLLFSGCAGDLEKIRLDVARISTEFVPDKRTDICNVEVVKISRDTLVLKGETTVADAEKTILNTLGAYDKILLDSVIILPDTIANKNYLGLATLSVINLRKEPDHSSELVSQVVMGTPVQILKSDGSWLLIRTPERYISWTESSSVRRVNSTEMNEWKKADRIVYESNSGWIYSNITGTAIVGDLVAGCIMARTGEADSFARVMLPDGREGFVDKSAVVPFDQLSNTTPTSDGILDHASLLTGIPYLWGGSSSKGVDCSGFVQNVFLMNRLIVARDASQQARYGDPVDISGDFSKLQPGDLLFFGSPEVISHVAIYKGGGEYIHSSGRVQVNSLDSTKNNYSRYRRSSLVKAQRVLGSHDPGIVSMRAHPWY